MRLTKLYIHNYKSFYDTTIELDKMNIVVGENNSGKSNLIDVLEFIDIAMSKDIERAISDKGGYDNLKNYNTNTKKVIIRATFEQKDINSKVVLLGNIPYQGIIQGEGEFTYSFSFSDEYTFFSIHINMLYIGTTNNDLIKEYLEKNYNITSDNMDIEKISFVVSNKINFKTNNKKLKKLFIPSSCNKNFILIHLHAILNNIGILSDKDLNIQKYNWSEHSNYISTYYFNVDKIRDKSHNESVVKLEKDGSNLGKNIYSFLRGSPEFDTVSNSLITTVNEINSIKVYEVAGNYILTFKEGENEININKVSDGTINFLATMVALNQPIDKSMLLVFEEPERHLHLRAVNYMLEAFRDSRKQILITTHSTEILKYANLEEIIFIYRDSDGDTQSIRADEIADLKGKMERLGYERPVTLDELIADRVIGDFE